MRCSERIAVAAMLILPWLCSPRAAAQGPVERGSVRLTAGLAKPYLDEPWQFAAGGALRLNVSRRLGIEPEFTMLRGSRFVQWSVVPGIVLDLGRPGKRVTPYVLGGVGYFHELDKSIRYERSELAWNAGAGLRIRAGSRAFISPEFRLGHISRVGVGIGWLF